MGQTDKHECEVMLKYMIHHNEAHCKELEVLADDFAALGDNETSSKIRAALEAYKKGNEILSSAAKPKEDQ